MTYGGQTICRNGAGANRESAERIARDEACTELTHGAHDGTRAVPEQRSQSHLETVMRFTGPAFLLFLSTCMIPIGVRAQVPPTSDGRAERTSAPCSASLLEVIYNGSVPQGQATATPLSLSMP